MKIKNFLRKIFPKRIFILRNQLKYYIFYIYEIIVYYKLNLKTFTGFVDCLNQGFK